MLLAAAAASAAPARALTCPPSKPDVTVELRVGAPAIDNSLPQPALQKLAGERHHQGRTLGLYRAKLEATWRVAIGRSAQAGEACRWIDRVTVMLAMPSRVIYIVRQRQPGTCAYESVLAHEREHQAIDEAVLAEYRARVEGAVGEAILALPPAAAVPDAEGAAAQARLTQPVAAALKRVFAALTQARAERQAALDTPQEYRRVRAACG